MNCSNMVSMHGISMKTDQPSSLKYNLRHNRSLCSLRQYLAIRLLASGDAKLVRRLPDFSTEESRKVRGVLETQSESDRRYRHVAENEVAFCLSDNSRVNRFRRTALGGGRTRCTQ